MTIQEFYDWAIQNGVADYDFQPEYEFDVREVDFEIREESKTVVI